MPEEEIDASSPKVAVIGAGLTGVSCAKKLLSHNINVTLFEKSRGLGGRLATRRLNDNLTADHGGQFFTARSEAFKAYVEHHCQAGQLAKWSPNGQPEREGQGDDWYVGATTMNRFIKADAQKMDIHLQRRITGLSPTAEGWQLEEEEGGSSLFDVVVCTAPAPQALELLNGQDAAIANSLRGVEIYPCWSLMIVFEQPCDVDFDVKRIDSGPVSWLARNTSKPGRAVHPDCWIVHASPDWSQANLELSQEQASELLLDAVKEIFGPSMPAIDTAQAHRWRYAKTHKALEEPYLVNQQKNLYFGGDWCFGARVEGAFLSGNAIAENIIDGLSA